MHEASEPHETTVLVRLPTLLLTLFPEAVSPVPLQAVNVAALIDSLDARWPGMRARLCDETPAVRRHINIFVEGRRAKLDTPLAHGADVYILTAISGG